MSKPNIYSLVFVHLYDHTTQRASVWGRMPQIREFDKYYTLISACLHITSK